MHKNALCICKYLHPVLICYNNLKRWIVVQLLDLAVVPLSLQLPLKEMPLTSALLKPMPIKSKNSDLKKVQDVPVIIRSISEAVLLYILPTENGIYKGVRKISRNKYA